MRNLCLITLIESLICFQNVVIGRILKNIITGENLDQISPFPDKSLPNGRKKKIADCLYDLGGPVKVDSAATRLSLW